MTKNELLSMGYGLIFGYFLGRYKKDSLVLLLFFTVVFFMMLKMGS